MARAGIARISFAVLTAVLIVGMTVPTFAARRPPPQQGFFSRLFGGSLFAPPPDDQEPSFTVRPKPRRVVRAPPAPADVVVVQPKDANAKKILVVGDYVADGIAWGLDQELADDPKFAVVDHANSNSGLVRADTYDWNKTLPDLLNQEKPDIVIVALGSNDRQQLRQANQRFAMHSPEWEKAYVERIDGLVETLKVYGRPFFWVGAPPVRNDAASADMVYLNGLFKAHVEAAAGNFVDIWNAFADADGAFISSGPDAEGQVRSLRTGDGINFTRAGRTKLGFFVQRDLRRKTGVDASSIDLAPSASQESRIEVQPDGRKILVGPVISLTDPRPVAATLAGGPDTPMPKPDSVQFKTIVKGEALPQVGGRVDDFAWPPPATSPPTADVLSAPPRWVPKPD